jgi:predicted glycoside hydrolase/deacetylase ChbG (UPF0249 family)
MSLNYVLWTVSTFSVIQVGASAAREREATYAERLGWPAGTRAVIFHVDDAGMSYDSNMGTIQAIENGVATSTSVMIPCPWVPHFVAYLKHHPEVDAGLHLTLNAEWRNYRWGPAAGQRTVPGLVDAHGYLWHGVSDVVEHATADEVETEIRAQVEKALAMGMQPTHLDSHMGTCFQPPFIERYVKVGIEMGIPILMFGGHMEHVRAEAGEFEPLIRALAKRLWDAGLPVIDDLVTQPTEANDYGQRKQQLIALLRDMKPGITQIIVHCTAPTEAFSHISSTGAARAAELRLMTDPDIRACIRDQGIILTTWRDLKQRRAARR